MLSKEVIKLAEANIKAIKKIAEKLSKECSECRGIGWTGGPSEWTGGTICRQCDGTGKVKGKWEWEPEIGDLIIRRIIGYGPCIYLYNFQHKIYAVDPKRHLTFCDKETNFIPLLHWERIGKILRSFNYTIVVDVGFHFIRAEKPHSIPQDIWDNASEYKNSRVIYSCNIYAAGVGPKSRFILTAFGKDYQHSVMLALNKLAKEK